MLGWVELSLQKRGARGLQISIPPPCSHHGIFFFLMLCCCCRRTVLDHQVMPCARLSRPSLLFVAAVLLAPSRVSAVCGGVCERSSSFKFERNQACAAQSVTYCLYILSLSMIVLYVIPISYNSEQSLHSTCKGCRRFPPL